MVKILFPVNYPDERSVRGKRNRKKSNLVTCASDVRKDLEERHSSSSGHWSTTQAGDPTHQYKVQPSPIKIGSCEPRKKLYM